MSGSIRMSRWVVVVFAIVALGSWRLGAAGETWRLVVAQRLAEDAAVRAGLEEVARECDKIGVSLRQDADDWSRTLVVELDRDPASADSEAFRWKTKGRTLTVTGAGPLGVAYGLFALADELAVERRAPTSDVTMTPQFPYRVAQLGRLVPSTFEGPPTDAASLADFLRRWRQKLIQVLRHGYNVIRIHATEDFVPWQEPHYAQRSARYLVYLREATALAHRYHLKVLLAGDEFIFLPELVGTGGKKLSPKEDLLWQALSEKYRRLLRAAPYLDGVSTRIGEVIPHFDFRHIDLIHAPADSPDPRIEERYRRFLWSVYRVAVSEFGKLYLHRTWVTNSWEQHSVPEIYRRTLEGFPRKNFIVAIKITKTDQWYYWVPFNPTFGSTDHTTLAQAELLCTAHGGAANLDFPGFWFEAGLQYAVRRGARGIFAFVREDGPGQRALTYVFGRLAWAPKRSAEELLRRWLRRTYGDSVAPMLYRVFRLAPEAIRDGLYVRPWALQEWNPIPHLRVRTFMFGGRPLFDRGRGHDAFLYELYLQAKPWGDETLIDLKRGLTTCDSMLAIFTRVADAIRSPDLRKELERALRHEHALIRMNVEYVRTILRYFGYRESRREADRLLLQEAIAGLADALGAYRRDFAVYDVRGVELLLKLARLAVRDLAALEDSLRTWPSDEEIRDWFQKERERYARLLNSGRKLVPVYRWKGTVDGSDLLEFRGEEVRVEHFLWGYPHQAAFEKLTDRDLTDCELAIRVRRGRGTVVLLPVQEKGVVRVYVEDTEPGVDVYDFEVVAVER